jgi:hypothetical protein
MTASSWRIDVLCIYTFCATLMFAPAARAGVSYQDPAVGWRYKYNGTFNASMGGYPPGFGDGATQALDGTWRHDQTDRWDGSAPGDTQPAPNYPAPGGIGAYTEGSTSYIRLQDPGNPEPHGWIQDDAQNKTRNSNRRLNLAHQIDFDGSLSGTQYLVLDNGFTVSFRARIPNSGPLDPVYTQVNSVNTVLPWFPPPPADYNSNSTVDAADYVSWRKRSGQTYQLPNEVENTTPGTVTQEDYTAWRARFGNTSNLGRGYPVHDEGRGMFYIVQNDPTFFNTDSAIAFSLFTSVDAANYCAAGANAELCSNPRGGLVMNNLGGTSPAAQIDTFDAGTLNLLQIPDASLSNWHEFWITITADGVTGTHTVNVYLDGSTTPTTFHVTATSDGNAEYLNNAWLAMGLSSSELFGSVDVDFYAYSLGVITPVAATSAFASAIPEPATCVLAFIATTIFVFRRDRTTVGR